MIDDRIGVRREAALAANAEDASLWRWFTALFEERRIRWRVSLDGYVVSVDRRQVAVDASFDRALRFAKANFDSN